MAQPNKAQIDEAKRTTRRYSQALGNLGRAWDLLHRTEGHGAVRPRSPASKEAEYLAEKCGDLYADPGGSITYLASARMSVAVDHLQGTANLYVAANSGIFSVWATGRSFLEMVGTVFWLMEPGIGSEARLGRVINDRLISLRGAVRLIERGLLPDEEAPIAADPGQVPGESLDVPPRQRIADILERSKKMGYEVISTSSGKQVRPERPSFGDLVDAVTSPGVYSLASGVSHGEIWTIAYHQADAEVDDPSGQERRLRQFYVSNQEYQALAIYLLMSFRATSGRFASYFGWDELSAFAESVQRSERDLLRGLAKPT